MFMRDVQSEPLYVQMKGRGVRTIGDEQLRNVTPNAFSKDCFFLVDAVGVTEHEKHIPTAGGDDEPSETITLKRLLELITHGNLQDKFLRTLASRLARISNKCTDDQKTTFAGMAGIGMKDLSLFIVIQQRWAIFFRYRHNAAFLFILKNDNFSLFYELFRHAVEKVCHTACIVSMAFLIVRTEVCNTSLDFHLRHLARTRDSNKICFVWKDAPA